MSWEKEKKAEHSALGFQSFFLCFLGPFSFSLNLSPGGSPPSGPPWLGWTHTHLPAP